MMGIILWWTLQRTTLWVTVWPSRRWTWCLGCCWASASAGCCCGWTESCTVRSERGGRVDITVGLKTPTCTRHNPTRGRDVRQRTPDVIVCYRFTVLVGLGPKAWTRICILKFYSVYVETDVFVTWLHPVPCESSSAVHKSWWNSSFFFFRYFNLSLFLT